MIPERLVIYFHRLKYDYDTLITPILNNDCSFKENDRFYQSLKRVRSETTVPFIYINPIL